MIKIYITLGIIGYIVMAMLMTTIAHIIECRDRYIEPKEHYNDIPDGAWIVLGCAWPVSLIITLGFVIWRILYHKIFVKFCGWVVDFIEKITKEKRRK